MARGWSNPIFLHLQFIFVALTLSTTTVFGANEIPSIVSVKVISVSNPQFRTNECLKDLKFEMRGRNFDSNMEIAVTRDKSAKDSFCNEATLIHLNEQVSSESGIYTITIPQGLQDDLYFCMKNYKLEQQQARWYHQGYDVFLLGAIDLTHIHQIKVSGIKVESSNNGIETDSDGIPSIFIETPSVIRIFGSGFTQNTIVAFTNVRMLPGDVCTVFPSPTIYPVDHVSEEKDTASINVILPEKVVGDTLYLCVKESNFSNATFYHQGSAPWVALQSHTYLIPIWGSILIIGTCLCFSALFSGLNLGLMSLDMTELKILKNTGTTKERQYARKIQPIRKHGNFLLCSILLGNVLVNSIFTILLDGLTSGVVAVVCSTIAIVLFGEITPQAICSRHGLAVGAKTIVVTKVVMGITSPIAYPVSKILDRLLGEEIGNVYNRERLKELVKVTTGENDLDRDEVNIISGALELRKKTVAEAMTRMEDAFMLDYEAILDFETVSEIMKSGYSRIPVYEGDRKKIVTTLYIKDLAFVDPDDNTPLKTLCQFYQNPCNFVFEDVTLDVMFKEFKEGNKGHMAFVHRVNNEGDGDPFYETIGLITLEDVIEELIQAEIMDETDTVTDNRSKRKRTSNRTKQDFTVFADRKGETNRIRISPQLTLATYQYLSTSVDLFKPSNISETILRRFLKQDIYNHIKKNKDWRNDDNAVIYQQGCAVDYFVLILEGRVEVTVGAEQLVFESGAFTYFGTQALAQNIGILDPSPSTMGSLQSLNMDTMLRYSFQPDYTVRASSDLLYMKVKRSLYLAAKKASLMEKSAREKDGDNYDEEVEKLLYSLGEEDSLGRQSPELKANQNITHSEPLSTTNSNVKLPDNAMNINPLSANRKSLNNGGAATSQKLLHPQNATITDDLTSSKEEEIALLPKNNS
ncbi:unextended protein [Onthophagus taurus]|uniref:unextended protein n=1 Tax=Onthophagus taurus TaxID=166361 RepID=UPI0039BDF14B